MASEPTDARAVIRDLVAALEQGEMWTAKLAQCAPEGMVGRGAIIRRSQDNIRAAIERGEAYLRAPSRTVPGAEGGE